MTGVMDSLQDEFLHFGYTLIQTKEFLNEQLFQVQSALLGFSCWDRGFTKPLSFLLTYPQGLDLWITIEIPQMGTR